MQMGKLGINVRVFPQHQVCSKHNHKMANAYSFDVINLWYSVYPLGAAKRILYVYFGMMTSTVYETRDEPANDL